MKDPIAHKMKITRAHKMETDISLFTQSMATVTYPMKLSVDFGYRVKFHFSYDFQELYFNTQCHNLETILLTMSTWNNILQLCTSRNQHKQGCFTPISISIIGSNNFLETVYIQNATISP